MANVQLMKKDSILDEIERVACPSASQRLFNGGRVEHHPTTLKSAHMALSSSKSKRSQAVHQTLSANVLTSFW